MAIQADASAMVEAYARGTLFSPMLFVLVMEALNALIMQVDDFGLFSSLQSPTIKCRASLYDDDLVVFLRPSNRDLHLMRGILELFANASGLTTNISNFQFSLIRCSEDDITLVHQLFPCQFAPFSCTYIGIPLSIYKLNKADIQPLVDAVGDRAFRCGKRTS